MADQEERDRANTGENAKIDTLTTKLNKIECDLSDKIGSIEEQLSRDIVKDIEKLTQQVF